MKYENCILHSIAILRSAELIVIVNSKFNMIRVGINGFGKIGRAITRIISQKRNKALCYKRSK